MFHKYKEPVDPLYGLEELKNELNLARMFLLSLPEFLWSFEAI